jgi:TRAP-type C4-dicarboxylate transport system permease small subunit
MSLARAETLCLQAASILAAAGLTVLIGFAATTLLDGSLRSLANHPIEVVGDVGSYLVAAAISACFPLAQLQRANITIEFAGLVLGDRIARALRAFAAVVVAVVMTAMARQMFIYAANEAAGGDATMMLGIKLAPFWYVVAVMFACAAIAQVLVSAIEIARCIRGAAAPIARHLP